MKQDIVIFGATGKVGKTFVDQILDKDADKRRITGVVSSQNWLYDPNGLGYKLALDFSGGVVDGYSYGGDHSMLLDEIRKLQKVPTSFVDVTASTDMIPTHLRVVGDSFYDGMVTANKNPLVKDIETFEKLTANNGKYQFQCSVMAGAGAIEKVDEAYELGDEVKEISGCFSGTLAYLCDQMRKGKKFSEALSNARSPERGYTEPDERDDLWGFDVGRKLLILARRAGKKVNLEDVNISPFLPNMAFGKEESLEKFRGKLQTYDVYFEERIKLAESEGKTIQYIAKMSTPSVDDLLEKGVSEIPIPIPMSLEVGLKKIPKSHLLGGLEGTLNGFEIITKERYPKGSSLVITASGAGLKVTAGNVRVGLNNLMRYDRRT